MITLSVLLGLCLTVFSQNVTVPIAPPASWTKEDYPNPRKDLYSCGRYGHKSWICDPSRYCTNGTQNDVDNIINVLHNITFECPGLQIAFAIANKMDIPPSHNAHTYAQAFATYLLNNWGVGSAQCHNGIDDRTIFIKTGIGAEKNLPGFIINNIIDAMKPYLRNADYNGAILYAINRIKAQLLNPAAPVSPPKPNDGGFAWYWWFVIAIGGICVFLLLARMCRFFSRSSYRPSRPANYTIVRDTLSDLQSNAKAGYFAQCPLCLVKFSDVACTTLPCSHQYCQNCIATSNGCCPLCEAREKDAQNYELMFRLRSFDTIYPGVLTTSMMHHYCHHHHDDWLCYGDFSSGSYGESTYATYGSTGYQVNGDDGGGWFGGDDGGGGGSNWGGDDGGGGGGDFGGGDFGGGGGGDFGGGGDYGGGGGGGDW